MLLLLLGNYIHHKSKELVHHDYSVCNAASAQIPKVTVFTQTRHQYLIYWNWNVVYVTIVPVKKLTRGISRATDNVNLVSRARCDIALDFKENAVCSVNQFFIETPVYTFTLPDLTIYPGKYRKKLSLMCSSCEISFINSSFCSLLSGSCDASI
jgi:hypothetical protein